MKQTRARKKKRCGEYARAESDAASDRRILVFKMLQHLTDEGVLEHVLSHDGRDAIYFAALGNAAILLNVLHDGAVHVFEKPAGCGDAEFHDRILLLFRSLRKVVTQPVIKDGNQKCYAAVGDDPDNLPEVWIMQQALPDSKLRKHLVALENSGFLPALAGESPGLRPTLNEFVGFRRKHTHQHGRLIRAIFVKSLGLARQYIRRAERVLVKQITSAWRRDGEAPHRTFKGASWPSKKNAKNAKGASDGSGLPRTTPRTNNGSFFWSPSEEEAEE